MRGSRTVLGEAGSAIPPAYSTPPASESLNVIFGEDDARTRKDHAPQNVALLSKIAINLLRMDTAHPKLSLRQQRKAAGWDDDVRMHMLGLRRICKCDCPGLPHT